MNKTPLFFSNNNRKVAKIAPMLGIEKNQVYCFDIPAGYTCPAADKCKSFAHKETGKITDGKNCQFRCYAASIESAFPSVRRAHWRNFNALFRLSLDAMVSLIIACIPNGTKVLRIHSSGDFFSLDYFMAWIKVAELHPEISFFGYTKILPYVKHAKPDNFHLVYSFGGKYDDAIENEPVAYVVKNIAEGLARGLAVACVANPADDYNFICKGNGMSFAIALHGTQPAKRKQK